MKQIYSLVSLMLVASWALAQDPSLSACNHPDGGIQISYDYGKGCPNANGDLSGMTEIGFHSGVNGWSTSVAWDAMNALTGENDGDDVFTVYIADPSDYYGESNITEYNFVFNQGAEVPADAWASEGKADDGMGGCADLNLSAASITETCALPLPPGIDVCLTADGGVHIDFDLEENCEDANGDLSGMNEIGFHSGANGWANVVAWDAANAVTGMNDGEDVFTVEIDDLEAYYGTTDIEDINFVFNQGAEFPADAWASEAKAPGEAGSCADFKFYLTDVVNTCELDEPEYPVSACNDPSGGIQFIFDYSDNCEAAPGDMSTMQALGFHSGVNAWASSVAWDAGNAVQAKVSDEEGVFIAHVSDPVTYYGAADITEYNMVFNQGAEGPGEPWASEGKADDGMGGCSDIKIMAADITETCAFTVSTFEPASTSQIQVFPNPASDQTIVSLPQEGRSFNISVTSITGAVVSQTSQYTGSTYAINVQSLDHGIYFVSVQDEQGRLAVEKIIVQ